MALPRPSLPDTDKSTAPSLCKAYRFLNLSTIVLLDGGFAGAVLVELEGVRDAAERRGAALGEVAGGTRFGFQREAKHFAQGDLIIASDESVSEPDFR